MDDNIKLSIEELVKLRPVLTEEDMKGRMTHLINEYGDRQVVETRNADEEIRRLNESTNSTYYLNVDWYLANGYVTIEEARKRIEGQLYGKDS